MHTSYSNQAGYLETISIRGGDYNQNPDTNLTVSRLTARLTTIRRGHCLRWVSQKSKFIRARARLDPESEGLSGYINQVIKTGTYPGNGLGSLGIGTPTFYHRAALEVGGSTPDRNCHTISA